MILLVNQLVFLPLSIGNAPSLKRTMPFNGIRFKRLTVKFEQSLLKGDEHIVFNLNGMVKSIENRRRGRQPRL